MRGLHSRAGGPAIPQGEVADPKTRRTLARASDGLVGRVPDPASNRTATHGPESSEERRVGARGLQARSALRKGASPLGVGRVPDPALRGSARYNRRVEPRRGTPRGGTRPTAWRQDAGLGGRFFPNAVRAGFGAGDLFRSAVSRRLPRRALVGGVDYDGWLSRVAARDRVFPLQLRVWLLVWPDSGLLAWHRLKSRIQKTPQAPSLRRFCFRTRVLGNHHHPPNIP